MAKITQGNSAFSQTGCSTTSSTCPDGSCPADDCDGIQNGDVLVYNAATGQNEPLSQLPTSVSQVLINNLIGTPTTPLN